MLIVETSIFTRQVTEQISAESYRHLQTVLICNPASGKLIPGGGGLRKIRWAAEGRGKRGGVRVIYYWAASYERLVMLFMYPKNACEDLTKAQIKLLKDLIESEFP